MKLISLIILTFFGQLLLAQTFTEVTPTLPFAGVSVGSTAFADVDGSQDILLIGENNAGLRISKLYTNDMVSSLKDVADKLSFEFILYPNPSGIDNINVNYTSEENGLLKAKVFGLTGRLIKKQEEQLEMGQQTFSIDIGSLTKGAYFIQLDDGKSKGTRKLFVL
mgnify:CR=1 FL=1